MQVVMLNMITSEFSTRNIWDQKAVDDTVKIVKRKKQTNKQKQLTENSIFSKAVLQKMREKLRHSQTNKNWMEIGTTSSALQECLKGVLRVVINGH